MCKIFFLRHGEQPTEKQELDKEDSEIGLTVQGAIRALQMPKLINKLIGKKETYQIHTYTNCKDGEPVSRAYYTTQLLRENSRCAGVILYNKSENMYELVNNIRNQAQYQDNIVVCWEHGRIPKIIQHLIGLNKEPNYEKLVKKFDKETYELTYQSMSEKEASSIVRCASKFKEDNIKYENDAIVGEKEMEYSPVFRVFLKKRKYDVYPGITINKADEGNWTIKWFL